MSNQEGDILKVDKDGNVSGNEEFWTSILWGVAGGAVLLAVLSLIYDSISSNNNQVEVSVSNDDISWTQRVSVDGSGVRVISSNGSIIVTNSNGNSRSVISGSGNSTVVVNGNSVQVAKGEVWVNGKKVEPEIIDQSKAR